MQHTAKKGPFFIRLKSKESFSAISIQICEHWIVYSTQISQWSDDNTAFFIQSNFVQDKVYVGRPDQAHFSNPKHLSVAIQGKLFVVRVQEYLHRKAVKRCIYANKQRGGNWDDHFSVFSTPTSGYDCADNLSWGNGNSSLRVFSSLNKFFRLPHLFQLVVQVVDSLRYLSLIITISGSE